MKPNKLNIFIFLFCLVCLIIAQVDFILDGAFRDYLWPIIIIATLVYIVIFGIDLYQRIGIYKALNRMAIIGINVINFITFVVVITLLPILRYYNLPINLITAINSTAITLYAVISGFSVIILNKFFPKQPNSIE